MVASIKSNNGDDKMREGEKNSEKAPMWIPVFTRENCVMAVTDIFESAYQYVKEMLELDFHFNNFRDIKGKVSMDLSEIKKLGTLVKQKIQTNPDYLVNCVKWCTEQGERLLKISCQIRELKYLQTLPNSQLLEWYERYREELLKYMAFLPAWVIMMRTFEEMISAKLKNTIRERGKEELIDSYLKEIIFPSKDNWVVKEVRDLIEIAAEIQTKSEIKEMFTKESPEQISKEIKEKDKDLFSRLEGHTNAFGFLDMYWFIGKPTTIEAVILRIKELLKEDCSQKLQKIDEEKQEKEQKYESTIKELQISGEILSLIEYAREHAYFRLHRMDVIFQAGYYARNLLEEVGRRIGISYDDVLWLTSEEIRAFLKIGNMPDLSRVEESKKTGYAVLMLNGEIKVITGKELRSLVEEEKIEEVKHLEGTIASVGKHTGKAKIITSIHEVNKVKDKDVLVTIMTKPAYMLALIRAGAVVTDEGGLLSHAAIVTRELGKPCVMGTNIATKVFVDGDLLEVDATSTKGIVRLLNRATLGKGDRVGTF